MAKISDKYGNPFLLTSLSPRENDPPEVQLRDAIAAAGMIPPERIVFDGKWHRFRCRAEDKPDDKAGSYIAWSDGIPAGSFGSWHGGWVPHAWRANIGRELTIDEAAAFHEQMARAESEHAKERAKSADIAADSCDYIWENATLATESHPYLAWKCIHPHGAKVTGDGRLIVPVRDINGELCSLQYIQYIHTADGKSASEKRYHSKGLIDSNHWVVGDGIDTADVTYMAEGFATGATIHEVTGKPVIIAYSASNLIKVLGIFREKYGPDKKIIIVADNDLSQTGERCAEQACAKHGGQWVMVPNKDQDANDYYRDGNDLLALLNPKKTEWLIHAPVFCSQPSPVSWLVRRWVQAESLVMIHGPSGCGKTFIVLDWALRMASGMDEWMGQRINPGPVVYLAGEGHHGMRSRVAAWQVYHNRQAERAWISSSGCDLNTPEGLARVLGHIGALPEPPRMVVVDTLHRFLKGDENSAEDTKGMLDACAELMHKLKCTVVIVHHTGVSEEAQHRGRGSSAWRGAVEIEISVAKKPDGPIELIQRKAKDSELMEPIYLALEKVELPGWVDDEGEPVTSVVVVPSGAPPSPPTRRETKLEGNRRLFERAWEASSRDVGDTGAPWLSRSQLREFLEANGMTKLAVNNALNVSRASGLIGSLTGAGLICASARLGVDGFLVINNVDSSSIILGNE